jgi:exodeoxyribonuclease VII large subunit
MSQKIYLKVPFIQKDIVKNLGARFDFNKKSWYIDESCDPQLFVEWLDNETQSSLLFRDVDKEDAFSLSGFSINQSTLKQPSLPEESAEEILPPSISLVHLLHRVEQSIRQNFGQSIWISAEVAQIKAHRGHHYLELVQRDESNGEELAKVRATIWSSRKHIITQFEEQTGKKIGADIKLLLEVHCVFHKRYGFSLDILQINVEYTLGQMQRKINAIRKKLISQGIYQQNKEKALPKLLTNICVISPENAAGLADFKHYLDPLVEQKLCQCNYHYATFQGNQATQSITKCLQQVMSQIESKGYQLIVIIRGGGSITDLQFLEEYEINQAICVADLPIWVGLGHQTDKLLINEIANRHFPTPTAVARQIVQWVLTPLHNAIAQWNEITLLAKQRIAKENQTLEKSNFLLHQQSRKILQKTAQQLSAQQTALKIHAIEEIKQLKKVVQSNYQTLPTLVTKALNIQSDTLATKQKSIHAQSNQFLQGYKNKLQITDSIIQNSHPKKILKRGFAIIRDHQQKPLKSLSQIAKNKEVTIQMQEGKIQAKIKK